MNASNKTKDYHIIVDEKPRKHPQSYITRTEIINYAAVPATYDVWQEGKGQNPDIKIINNNPITLEEHGIEKFYTVNNQIDKG